MGKKYSYTKNEQNVRPEYRQKINRAASSVEVNNFFNHAVTELCNSIFEPNMLLDRDDIVLSSEEKPFFTVSERLRANEAFSSVWDNSDLPQVISRLAKPAVNRSRHLQKHPEKTTSKIRM